MAAPIKWKHGEESSSFGKDSAGMKTLLKKEAGNNIKPTESTERHRMRFLTMLAESAKENRKKG